MAVLGDSWGVSTRKRSENGLLPKEVRERLQAVVVDANAYGPVGPDLRNLASLAKDLSGIGIEVWVPEPVAWEWVEHLTKEWVAARASVATAIPLRKAGLHVALHFDSDYKSEAAVAEAFLARLKATPYLEVVPLTGDSAIEGLRDQILLRSPAKQKSEVKTGGSDSAWLRTVLAKVDRAGDKLLFFSSDGDIRRAYEAWGYQPPLMRSLRDIRVSLFEYLPASVEDQWLIAESLAGRMPIELRASTSEEEDSAVIDSVAGLAAALQDHPHYDGITAAHVTRLTALAGLSDVKRKQPEPDHEDPADPDARTFLADVFFLAEAEAIRTVQIHGSSQAVAMDAESRSGLLVRARMTLTIRNQTLETMRSDGEAVVFSAPRFEETEDAWQAVAETLSAVPGLRLPDDWVNWPGGREHQVRVAGRDQALDVYWSRYDPESLSVHIDGEEVTVTCEYDETTWWGGKDGMHMEPPYYLSAESSMDSVLNPAWEIPRWIIAKLTKHGDQPTT